MQILRLVQGKILFDEFESSDLGSNWQVIPDDSTRYSLTERPGYLKAFHGDTNLLILTNEPDEYVVDIRNEYVPLNAQVSSGLSVYKSIDCQLEFLEYFDSSKDASVVYQYLRLEKDGTVYTGYGRNTDTAPWELIGSGEFESSGKVGLSIKGPSIAGSSDYNLDYFRMYKNHYVQILNVPVGYSVELYSSSNIRLYVSKVTDPYSGVKLKFTEVPPMDGYFCVYDNLGNLTLTSSIFEIVGGDVFYYGAAPLVTVNGIDMYTDQEYFLGYFKSNLIKFEVDLYNPYLSDFTNIMLQAVQYDTDPGYKCVNFSLTANGTYTPSVTIPKLGQGEHVTVYGQVTRDINSLVKNNADPFKFNLALAY
jgi:hypothetical protein